jgi:hypothetical protein
VLPRRLPPVLPTPLFAKLCTTILAFVHLAKGVSKSQHHSESPRHACAHCGGFAAAAPRRAGTLVSVSLWGLPLPWPLGIIGLVGRYPANNLIPRGPILKRKGSNSPSFLTIKRSSIDGLSGITLSFPRLFPSSGEVDHVLLSRLPRLQVQA